MNFGGLIFGGLVALGGSPIDAIFADGAPFRQIFWQADAAQSAEGSSFPQVGQIVPEVVLEEHSFDELVITENPVEQNAAIADHAYKRPAELVIRAGWSAASEQPIDGVPFPAPPDPDYLARLYDALLRLQESRTLFSVMTGKRLYTNLLMASLEVTTDGRTEHALIFRARMRQVILVQTQVVTVKGKEVQADPTKTAPVVDGGTVQPIQQDPTGTFKPPPNTNPPFSSSGGANQIIMPAPPAMPSPLLTPRQGSVGYSSSDGSGTIRFAAPAPPAPATTSGSPVPAPSNPERSFSGPIDPGVTMPMPSR